MGDVKIEQIGRMRKTWADPFALYKYSLEPQKFHLSFVRTKIIKFKEKYGGRESTFLPQFK